MTEFGVWDLYMKDLSKKDSFLLLNYYKRHQFSGEKRDEKGKFLGHHFWRYMRIQDGMKTYHNGNLWNIYRCAVEL